MTPVVARHDDNTVEDVRFLLDTGEHPERIARQVGFPTVGAAARWLHRRGHADLARRFELRHYRRAAG